MIKYKEAVADLQLDMDLAGVGEERWHYPTGAKASGATGGQSGLNAAALS